MPTLHEVLTNYLQDEERAFYLETFKNYLHYPVVTLYEYMPNIDNAQLVVGADINTEDETAIVWELPRLFVDFQRGI